MKKLAFPAGAKIALGAFLALAAEVAGQDSAPELPRVIQAQAPFYHPFARTVNMHGTVRIRVFTDGERTIEAEVEDDGGIPVLARSARENALTWRFSSHQPIDFEVTYRYFLAERLEDSNGAQTGTKVVFRFPTSVDVYAVRWRSLHGAGARSAIPAGTWPSGEREAWENLAEVGSIGHQEERNRMRRLEARVANDFPTLRRN